MADAAVFAALKTLGDVLVNEVLQCATSQTSELMSMLSELESRMERIRIELRVMQAFLDETNMHDRNNKTREVWLEEVRNLAYHIQNIVNDFLSLVHTREDTGIRSYVKRLFREPSFGPFRRIVSQLQEAERSLKNLSETKERWVSSTSFGLSGNNNPQYDCNECSRHAAIKAYFIDECELVGVEENRALLTSWLNSKGLNLLIMSVWGMGGLGKTTLVSNVFKRERNNFDCYAWISISQMYTVDHLLRNLIVEICKSEKRVSSDTSSMDLRELKETLRELLREKKYVIVLDDAWSPSAFNDIRDAFVDSQKGSRIFITSRDAKVSRLATESHRLELRPLGESESWELFCQKAFGPEKYHDCPPQLEKWAREITAKCEGLPLALVSIGSMLLLREKSAGEWKRVHDQLSWEFEHNPSFDNLRNILNLSFNYLPKNLKNCFLYCCMFPEDHLLTRKILFKLWIAEGFIEERGTSTLEEVAEGYLAELIRLSMLQLVETNEFGKLLKRCRIHDTLRELAISLCAKENFGFLHVNNNKIVNVDTNARRLSVIKSSNDIRYDANLSQLRTFLSFDSMLSSSLLSSILLNSRYLTILNLDGLASETLPDTVGDLLNLQYLGLRDTKIKFIPNSIKKLCNLQTLDLYRSKIVTLPNCIVELSKLRHLCAAIELDRTRVSFRYEVGIHVPYGLFHLKDLQTLKALEADAEVVKKLGNLTQLRSLTMWNVKESYSTDLCISLSKMHFLCSLYITASSENEFFHLGALNSPPPQLQKLYLRGRLKENVFESPLFQVSGRNLHSLGLGWSRLQSDPLPSLSHLSNLKILDLVRAFDGKRLVFRAGWFPKLKFVLLQELPSLVEVEIEEGTMVKVEQIVFRDMEQMIEIPKGIEHLASLKELHCVGLSANFGGLVKGYNKLRHFGCYFNPMRCDD